MKQNKIIISRPIRESTPNGKERKMKTPKLIYTYWHEDRANSGCIIHEIRIYQPRASRAFTSMLGEELFSVRGQSNVDTDYNRGLRRAYGLRFESLPVERPESFKIAVKLANAACRKDNGIPEIIRELKKLGAVRYALGKVEDPKSYNGKEFMPRKYASRKSVAYWNAVKAGLELAA